MHFSPELIWFLVGLALVLSEFMIPGIILVFFGLGAWITAVASWLGLTPGLSAQLLTFAASSLVLLALLRSRFRNRLTGYVGDDHDPSRNIDDFTGQTVQVIEEIGPDNQEGVVEFKGAHWKARSISSIHTGEKAVITGVDGIALLVKPANPQEEV